MNGHVHQPRRIARAVALVALGAAILGSATAAASGPSTRFHTPSAPGFLAVVGTHVWVAAHRGGVLYELDPHTNRIVRTIQMGDDICGLAVSGSYLELGTGCEPNLLSVVDTRSGKTVRHFTHGETVERWGGSAWRWAPNGVLTRLDPRTHVVLKRFRVRNAEGPTIAVGGSLWIPCDAWVTRIVLATNTASVIPLPGGLAEAAADQGYAVAAQLAATPGKIWIGNPAGVYWVDEATEKAARVPGTRIGDLDQWGNIGIVSGEGSVFARTGSDTVSRIDPKTGTVVAKYPAGGGGGAVAVGFGSLWVTNFGTDTTWRIPLR